MIYGHQIYGHHEENKEAEVGFRKICWLSTGGRFGFGRSAASRGFEYRYHYHDGHSDDYDCNNNYG